MKILIKRLYAGLVDAIFIAVGVGMIYYIFIQQSIKSGDFKISYNELDMNITAITMVLLFFYYIICEIIGQSIGKKIFNLKIKYKGKGIFARILRPVVKIITVYLWPLAIISVFLPEKKMFYDFLTGTHIETVEDDITRGSL